VASWFVSPPQQRVVSEFIAQFELYFPSYVLVEALRIRESTKAHNREFQEFAQDFVAAWLTEVPVTLKELYADAELRRISRGFGIADASVFYVAAEKAANVLTNDERLYANVQAVPNAGIVLFRNVMTGNYDVG
jgi:predicted nucleic acid-binding protein